MQDIGEALAEARAGKVVQIAPRRCSEHPTVRNRVTLLADLERQCRDMTTPGHRRQNARGLQRSPQRVLFTGVAHTLGGPVEDHRADIVVISAGHTGEVGFFLTSGSGPASRSTRTGECSVDVLVKNTECGCGAHRELLDPRTPDALAAHCTSMARDAFFRNGRPTRRFQATTDHQSFRLSSTAEPAGSGLPSLLPDDVAPPADPGDGVPDPTELRARLEAVVRPATVEREVDDLVSLLESSRRRSAAGLPTPEVSHHLVFSGPPGTDRATWPASTRGTRTIRGVLPRDGAGRGDTRGSARPVRRPYRAAHRGSLRKCPGWRAVHRRDLHSHS